ncbi:hypothetical protein BLA29_006232, partial [Euroglyphus maynei]
MKSASEPNSNVPFRCSIPSTRAGCNVAHSIASTIEQSGTFVCKYRTHLSNVAIEPHSVSVPTKYAQLFLISIISEPILCRPVSRPVADMASLTRTIP